MEQEPYGIIYRYSFPNDGDYIGQTIQGMNARFNGHLRDTKAGSNLPVHNAIRKYYSETEEENRMKKEILAYAYSFEELNMLEVKYIREYNTFRGNNPRGYNLTIGGEGCKSYSFTEEQKERCREIQQKRKEEHPEIAIAHEKFMKQRAIDNPDIGEKHSIHMKQLYANHPEKKEYMSNLKIQQNKDNPEMARQQSELKLMYYEDNKDAIENLRKQTIKKWQNPENRKRIMDEKRNRFSKPFEVYKDGIFVDEFDYVPDCALKLFGKQQDSNITAVLKGRKKSHYGFTFRYK